jgi:hypothetical protein
MDGISETIKYTSTYNEDSQEKRRERRAGGMAQVVGHLPSKFETLSSKSSTAKKNLKK